jgi:hypothetical protein
MTTERKELSVNQLDYFEIRQNIKNFMKSQEQFLDYDFEGSGLSVLLDVLSYVTHYQGIYNNLTANELFLDTALKRSSLVSHAKSLGYVPRSRSAPVATVDITYANAVPTILPVGQVFTTKIGNKTYNFVNTDSYTPVDGQTPNVQDVEIREGVLKTLTFVTPDSKPYQKFRIKDDSIDTKTIKITVTKSPSSNSGITDVWTLGTNAVTINGESLAYFIEEDYDGAYSIGFGDGVIGKKLEAGNVVTVTYLQTKGAEANDAGSTDTTQNPSFLYSNNTVVVKSQAAGGAERESIASIRFNAPKAYAAQNRAITTSDFEALINNNFSGFQSALVYGGEFATPPEFGKVIVVLKPNTATLVPSSLKNSIESFLRNRCSVSITPEVKDPTPLYVRYALSAVYNPSKTVLREPYLISTIKSITSQYIQDNTIGFNSSVSFSKLEKRLLEGVSGLETIEIEPSLEYRFFPIEDTATNYEFKFKNPILHEFDGYTPVISSSEFRFVDADGIEKNVFLDDDGFGKLRIYRMVGGSKEYFTEVDFGKVNYKTGDISFNSFALSTVNTTIPISVFAKIDGGRLISSETFILLEDTRDPTNAVVNLTSDNRPDSRTNAAGEIYLGTSSLSSADTTTQSVSTTTTTSTTTSTSTGGGY